MNVTIDKKEEFDKIYHGNFNNDIKSKINITYKNYIIEAIHYSDIILLLLYLNNKEIDTKIINKNKLYKIHKDIKIKIYENISYNSLKNILDFEFVSTVIHPYKGCLNNIKNIIFNNLLTIVLIKDSEGKLEEHLCKILLFKIENDKICELDENLK